MAIVFAKHVFPATGNEIVFRANVGEFSEIGKMSYLEVVFGEKRTGCYNDPKQPGHHFVMGPGAYFPLEEMVAARDYYHEMVEYYTDVNTRSDEELDERFKSLSKKGYTLAEIARKNDAWLVVQNFSQRQEMEAYVAGTSAVFSHHLKLNHNICLPVLDRVKNALSYLNDFPDILRTNGISLRAGCFLYLLTCTTKYSGEVREVGSDWVAPIDWIVDNFHNNEDFKVALASVEAIST